jgi:3-oxoadipate enol-lactonase
MRSSFASMMVLPVSDADRADILDQSATVTPACYVEAFDAWRGADFADQVGRIAVPTTVFGGSAEQPLNPGVLQAGVVNLIPGATFQAIEGAGHYPQYEAPDRFSKALFAACQA